jgi:hypothetical protein
MVTMQGELKQAVYLALNEDHQTLRESGKKTFMNSHPFPPENGAVQTA